MTSRTRQEAGFTIVELLLVCVISLVIFGATTTAWLSVWRSNTSVETQNQNVETARQGIDRAARQLRNLANPSVNAVKTIDRATGYDFIFQTSDPAKTWVRYCLATSGGKATNDQAVLYEAESPNTKAIDDGMRGGCPGVGWARTRVVVEHVTSKVGGADRPVFTFRCQPGASPGCGAVTDEYPKITSVGIALWLDVDPKDRVHEMQVSTGVFLRNQNEAPTAKVTWSPLAQRKILLNGSGSSDPESRTLEYFWFEDTPPSDSEIKSTPCTAPFPSAKWQGITWTKEWATTVPLGTPKTFYLVVRDPGCLTSQAQSPSDLKVPQ